MSKEVDKKPEEKGVTFAKVQKKAGGLLDKAFWGGIGFTALATYIFSPLAMLGGGFVGGYVGNKSAAKYDDPKTPKMNIFRRIVASSIGAVIGVGVVFGAAFIGGVIGGPIGAIAGAAVGAGITYKLSQKAAAKYASHDAEKESKKSHDTPAKDRQHERSQGKDHQQEQEQSQTFAKFLEEFDIKKHNAQNIPEERLMEFVAKKYVAEGSPLEKESREEEVKALVEAVGPSRDSLHKVKAQLQEKGATVRSVIDRQQKKGRGV